MRARADAWTATRRHQLVACRAPPSSANVCDGSAVLRAAAAAVAPAPLKQRRKLQALTWCRRGAGQRRCLLEVPAAAAGHAGAPAPAPVAAARGAAICGVPSRPDNSPVSVLRFGAHSTHPQPSRLPKTASPKRLRRVLRAAPLPHPHRHAMGRDGRAGVLGGCIHWGAGAAEVGWAAAASGKRLAIPAGGGARPRRSAARRFGSVVIVASIRS